MTAAQIQQLAENLAKDGQLTSTLLIFQPRPENTKFYCEDDPRPVVLSGNHRHEAAEMAGLEDSPCLELLTPITDQQAIAIQLSHNAISGQDDQSLLRALYEDLDLAGQKYSGLTDDSFGTETLDISSLSLPSLDYVEVLLMFIPGREDCFIETLDRLKGRAEAKTVPPVILGDKASFASLFDAIIGVKNKLNIRNNATALQSMAEIVNDWLDQQEQQDAEDGDIDSTNQPNPSESIPSH